MSTPEWNPIKNGIWKASPSRGLAETEPIAPSPEPEHKHEEDQPPVTVVSFAQPHSPSPEPEPEQPEVPSSPRYSPTPDPVNEELHPDDIPENGPDDEPEFDSHGYEIEYRGGFPICPIYKDDYEDY